MSSFAPVRRSPQRSPWSGQPIAPPPEVVTALAAAREAAAARAAEEEQEALARESRHTVLLGLAGLATGLALAGVYDWITAGPGLRVMVGL